MVFNFRLVHFLAVLLLAGAAVFSFDAALHGLWANLAIGLMIACALAAVIWITFESKTAIFRSPLPTRPDASQDLRILLDQVPIPLIRYSETDGAHAVNRAARTLFQTDGLITEDANALIHAITDDASKDRRILPIFGRQYALSVNEITSDDARARLATLTDVQIEMHKAEAAALKDTLQILSHEIMNSLTPVSSLADIADSYLDTETGPDIPAAREALEMLSRRAVSLTRFIEAYRSVARLPEPVFQLIDPARLVSDIAAFFARSPLASGVTFRVDAGSELPRVKLDEGQVNQAIINVLTNAVEATENQSVPPEVHITVELVHRNVRIQVRDNGSGVPDAIRANLFSALTTTKAQGTGTGLNLARQIALAQGGNLRLVENDPDTMTTFEFTFPAQT